MAIVSSSKKPEKEESPEEVLARLDEMTKKLSGISTGDDFETVPEIEVVQTHPVLTEMLWVEGMPHPNIWIPDYHALMHHQGKYDFKICEATSPVLGVKCTQRSQRCDGGWAHVAGMGGSYAHHANTANDMMLEIWSGQTGSPFVVNGYDHNKHVRGISNPYANETGLNNCGERNSRGNLICSMPTGHLYSHIACTAAILEVWPNTTPVS